VIDTPFVVTVNSLAPAIQRPFASVATRPPTLTVEANE
jgi:hypothetical protein